MRPSQDFLERLWVEVINAQPNGKRFSNRPNQSNFIQSALKEVAAALKRLREQGVDEASLEMLARFVRYETCFGVLVALDDPGFGAEKIAGIHREFVQSTPKSRGRTRKEKFIRWLWETEFLFNDDGEWLTDATEKELRMEAFPGLFQSVKRLLGKAKNMRDVGLLQGGNRYMACAATLKLLEEAGFERGDEPVALHEMLLESRPDESSGKTKPRGRGGPDPTEPLWRVKAAQTLTFSPDSKTLAVAGASSPVRSVDLATGQERRTCEGIRIHIYRIVFSPDGKLVTAGQIHKNLSVCDAKTGRLLHSLKRDENEISGLEHAPSGELICSSWRDCISVFDARTGAKLPDLRINKDETMVDAITLFDKGSKLAVLWDCKVSVWSWPERKRLLEFGCLGGLSTDIAASPNGRELAIADDEKGVHFVSASNGKRRDLIKAKELYKGLAFTPDGNHLVINLYREDQIGIWNTRTLNEVRRIKVKGGLFDLAVSPDGEFLAGAGGRGALVWRLPPLLEKA